MDGPAVVRDQRSLLGQNIMLVVLERTTLSELCEFVI